MMYIKPIVRWSLMCIVLYVVGSDNAANRTVHRCRDVVISVNITNNDINSLTECPGPTRLFDVISTDGNVFMMCVCPGSDPDGFVTEPKGDPVEYDI
jgi:hypothetical protein